MNSMDFVLDVIVRGLREDQLIAVCSKLNSYRENISLECILQLLVSGFSISISSESIDSHVACTVALQQLHGELHDSLFLIET